ncbi:radical SAM protein [bacterium]|nr:radical SAM protein [bacterium]
MAPKYFLPDHSGLLTRVRYRLIDHRVPTPPFPENVQIQTVSGCNANCVFCPNKKTELDIPLGNKMEDGLFRSIVDQITEQPTVRRISPYLMNESMLDSGLPERIKYITDKKQPHQYTKINSHGNACTERMAKGLLDAGLDRVNFSVQGIDPDVYQDLMSLRLEKTLENIARMQKLRDEGGYKTRIRVCMLRTTAIEPHLPAIKKFWAERNVTLNINQLENRGNHKKIKSVEIANRALQTYDWCPRLFNQIYILFDGRMVMCCADWEQTGIMGDASKDRLSEIWSNATYKEYRRRFLDGDVKGLICDGCTKDSEDDED